MKIIAANFKMNLTKTEIDNYLNTIKGKIDKNVIFFPSDIYLNDFSSYLTGSQNISFIEKGAVTGDISIIQLLDMNIKYTLIGHSERRLYFNDNNYINSKIRLALLNKITPILCIGENLEEYQKKVTLKKLTKQIDEAFLTNNSILNDSLIVAYEPIWSIGTGNILDNKTIVEVIDFIKKYILNNYKLNLKVIYGGSVNLNNIGNLEKISNLDGYLIGNASLDAKSFLDLTSKIK